MTLRATIRDFINRVLGFDHFHEIIHHISDYTFLFPLGPLNYSGYFENCTPLRLELGIVYRLANSIAVYEETE